MNKKKSIINIGPGPKALDYIKLYPNSSSTNLLEKALDTSVEYGNSPKKPLKLNRDMVYSPSRNSEQIGINEDLC